ncbi:unnamed protein product, partial [Urochloa humidicola]
PDPFPRSSSDPAATPDAVPEAAVAPSRARSASPALPPPASASPAMGSSPSASGGSVEVVELRRQLHRRWMSTAAAGLAPPRVLGRDLDLGSGGGEELQLRHRGHGRREKRRPVSTAAPPPSKPDQMLTFCNVPCSRQVKIQKMLSKLEEKLMRRVSVCGIISHM